jgi:hypothetical protein
VTAHQLAVGAERADAEKVVVVKDASHVVMLSQRNGQIIDKAAASGVM